MRDFKAGRDINVGGNVNIHDHSSEPKLLIQCTNEELFDEQQHRKAVLSNERKHKSKLLNIVWLFIGVIFGGSALWFYIKDDTNLSSLLLGVGGLAVGVTGEIVKKPTEFELRQLEALKEIDYLLRERV
jgi:hypothetical protein